MPRPASAVTSSGRRSGGRGAKFAAVSGITWSSVISPWKSAEWNEGRLAMVPGEGRRTFVRSQATRDAAALEGRFGRPPALPSGCVRDSYTEDRQLFPQAI